VNLSIGEIVKGVARLRAGRKKREWQSWLLTMERLYIGNLLPAATD
jgi:hypothetical protein